MGTSSYSVNDWNNYVRSTRLDTAVSAQQIYRSSYALPEFNPKNIKVRESCCLLYTSDAADEILGV